MEKKEIIKELMTIPGVGKSIAEDLYSQGIHSVSQLKNNDPDLLYQNQCKLQGIVLDRCVLYTFRCAVYYASTSNPQPELLKWWNWKDK